MKLTIALAFLLPFALSVHAQEITPAFTLQEPQAVVEGMTYDKKTGKFYFGETLSRKILVYTNDGTPSTSIDAGKDGLFSFLGMTVSLQQHLWICGSTELNGKKKMAVFRYNLANNRLVSRYIDTGEAKIFNDIAIAADGSVYITNTNSSSLHIVDTVNGTVNLFVKSDSLLYANGITVLGDALYVSAYRGFARVDTKTKEVSLAKLPQGIIAGIDGVYAFGNALIGIQNVLFPFSISRFHLSGDGRSIAQGELLVANHPSFKVPTTGVVVNDTFYFMANSNIEYFDFDTGKPRDVGSIEKIRVMRISLK